MRLVVPTRERFRNRPPSRPKLSRQGRKSQPWLVRARGTVGIAILIPFGCLAFFIKPWAEPGTLGAVPWEGAGWCLLLAGTVFRFWATAYIGGHKGEQVVTQGPYSLCRNPLYLGNFLIGLSIGIFVQSLVFTLGVLIASALYLSTTMRTEERELGQRFGSEYADYCRRVPRFWPRLSGFQTPFRIEVDVRCLRIEAFRSLRLAAIPLIVHLVPLLRAIVF